uniref:Uncharacterized protein n=1 Tax=Anguilla anguilla TaxID=7936 RepID=A0A0E9V446_ANGAN
MVIADLRTFLKGLILF